MNLVANFFKAFGKHISDDQLAEVRSWAFPTSVGLRACKDSLQDAFQYALDDQNLQPYLCNLVVERNGSDVAHPILDAIDEAIEGCAFMTTRLRRLNNHAGTKLGLSGKPVTTYMSSWLPPHLTDTYGVIYLDMLLRAVWIEKISS